MAPRTLSDLEALFSGPHLLPYLRIAVFGLITRNLAVLLVNPDHLKDLNDWRLEQTPL
jgi:hypothetical protein